MPPTAAEVYEHLAQRGHRLTRTRRAVIEALAGAGEPVSAGALHQAVGTLRADLVTVYRTLHWLVELRLARAVAAGAGGDRFELAWPDAHTHHLHCEGCGAVRTVEVCGLDAGVAERIFREFGFRVSHHRLTFHGRCAECAARGGDRGGAAGGAAA